ncbi:MAG: hypothetical protein H0T71_08915, partial [Acidobacteria bacterium]|nr:hypothetical protein [Acidobacteriota bacterium]
VAQAYRVDVTPTRITFTFLPHQKVPRQQCEDLTAFLEDVAAKVTGTRIAVVVATVDAASLPGLATPGAPDAPSSPAAHSSAAPGSPRTTGSPTTASEALRQEALSDPSVQALLEIFPVEKTKIEEM